MPWQKFSFAILHYSLLNKSNSFLTGPKTVESVTIHTRMTPPAWYCRLVYLSQRREIEEYDFDDDISELREGEEESLYPDDFDYDDARASGFVLAQARTWRTANAAMMRMPHQRTK